MRKEEGEDKTSYTEEGPWHTSIHLTKYIRKDKQNTKNQKYCTNTYAKVKKMKNKRETDAQFFLFQEERLEGNKNIQ